MDEIQDCIADAQFGEVLRGRENTRPNVKTTAPPEDFDPHVFARERGIDLEYCVGQPCGVYLLQKAFPEVKSVYSFLAELQEFKGVENPEIDAYTVLLSSAQKLPPKYKSAVEKIVQTLGNTVLPQLQSTPSMGRLLHSGAHPHDSGDGDGDGDSGGDGGAEVGDLKLEDTITLDDAEVTMEPDDERMVEEELARKKLSLTRQRTENKRESLELFNELMDRVLVDQKAYWDRFQRMANFTRLMEALWYCEQPVGLGSFNIFRDLGRGAFGVVSGAKFKATGALVALKCMNKKLVKGKNALKLVKAEREVLAKLGAHPSHFTVFLQYSFHDKDTFFLALPLCSGGDLQYHLAVERFFEPERARYHIAEVVLGIAHLHGLGILYRDLKPDNILLDEEGHCRISDMGLAIITNGKMLRGRAGTPGYWAPEMLQKKRYSYPVDWWSLGCVLYELLAGRCPFSKLNSKMERDEATLKWPVTFPHRLGCGIGGEQREFPEDAKRFILRLLERDKTRRLGASERGAEDVKEDPYFSSIDWAKLGRLEVEPPWKPRREAIHAFNQSDIDGKSNEHDYRKLKLAPEDEIDNFDFISQLKHQQDLVGVLQLEDEGKLAYLEKTEGVACCAIA